MADSDDEIMRAWLKLALLAIAVFVGIAFGLATLIRVWWF